MSGWTPGGVTPASEAHLSCQTRSSQAGNYVYCADTAADQRHHASSRRRACSRKNLRNKGIRLSLPKFP